LETIRKDTSIMGNIKNKKIKKSLKSLKKKNNKIKNGIKSEINGWMCITIKGAPYARGYAHGHLLKKEF
jgi:hypothetical protein